jgi:hypothetical protein
MWRYFCGFLAAAMVVSVICGMFDPIESFWADVGLAAGYAIGVLWLGDGIFLRGIFLDSDDAKRLEVLFAKAPQWRSNLVLIGAFWGLVAATSTWVLAHQSESIWVLVIPILVFGGVLWGLLIKIRRATGA